MAGQYGNQTVSMLNLRLARIDAEQHLLMIEGGVPGAKGSLVLVRKAVKTRLKKK
jgi:large subunit ribosomal protein L3